MCSSWPASYPRLSELCALARSDERDHILRKIPNEVKKSPSVFKGIEEDLARLPAPAWSSFKKRMLESIQKAPKREYQQFVDTLNELKGYRYLENQGYSDIEFIPRSDDRETPDLKASASGRSLALVEVKTLNQSDDEVAHIEENTSRLEVGEELIVRSVQVGLPDALKRKIRDTIAKAKSQLVSYESDVPDICRVIFLVIKLDTIQALDQRNWNGLDIFLTQQQESHLGVKIEYVLDGRGVPSN